MTMVDWDDSYSLDIPEIDEQHKCLIAIMNELYTALANKSEPQRIGQVLDKLIDYMRIHFAVEEALMRILDYEEYPQHKASHDAIVRQVLAYQAAFRAGDEQVGSQLLEFLKDWLFTHIQQVDQRFGASLRQLKAKKSWFKPFC